MPKKSSSDKTEGLTYEQALTRIEEIAALLEDGKITVDESLLLFEESVKLAAFCDSKLKSAEQRIKTVTEGEK